METRLALGSKQRWLWTAFTLLCASVLLHLAIYLTDHHSTALLLLAAGVALFALVGIGASAYVYRLTPESLPALRSRAQRWRTPYLVVALGTGFAFGTLIRPEWVYAHIALMIGVGFSLGYALLYADAPPIPRRRLLIAAGASAIAITLVRLYGLSEYPSHIIIDEPWDLGWALGYLQRGYFTDPLMYYGGYDIQRFMLPVAWWISLVGVGFWQVRLFFFLLIFPLIGLTVLAARNWSISGAVVALIMFSSAIVMSAARIRHDIGLALAVAASLWLYTEAVKRQRNRLHFLAGLMIGLGWFAHYHAIGFGVALTISLYAPEIVARWRRGEWLPSPQVWFYVAGGLLGAVIVFLFQILPDWQGFVTARALRSPTTLGEYLNTFVAHWQTMADYSQFEFVLVIAALVVALWRHRKLDVQLVLLVIMLHVTLALQASQPYVYYVVPITPVYALLIGAMFASQPPSQLEPSRSAWITAALIVVANLGLTLHTPILQIVNRKPIQLQTPPAITWIRTHVPTNDTIVAEHWYYLWLTDYPFISEATPDYAPPEIRQEPRETVWEQIAPDVVMIDPNLATCCVKPIFDPDYLRSRGYEQIAQIPGDSAPILIYEKGSP